MKTAVKATERLSYGSVRAVVCEEAAGNGSSYSISFVGTEIVVSKAGVRNYVNNLFRVDERQVPGFINIVKFDD